MLALSNTIKDNLNTTPTTLVYGTSLTYLAMCYLSIETSHIRIVSSSFLTILLPLNHAKHNTTAALTHLSLYLLTLSRCLSGMKNLTHTCLRGTVYMVYRTTPTSFNAAAQKTTLLLNIANWPWLRAINYLLLHHAAAAHLLCCMVPANSGSLNWES